ncbi:DUF6361 family protein [Ensifer adhaerens]|uniref:DUF6361 family protein n=1 Tax=Ensifer adhaerens TaxID=106592 RepID=UPI001C4E1245|nr:DUF6361 family protein [Ensifer adhaerens]MBW0365851.1 hypothetical protein [Ensifer adhaerens]UCM20244.1 DUF6361 family protein [Ensifer adhaerens]
MSYLAWIDFDPEERRRAQALIDLFKQPEARDELGLSTVRDGISDLLFPGTSTIQTRLRYMLFIPWIYREAQGRRITQIERAKFVREAEFRLSEALLKGGETIGVIGREAGRGLKRLPSSVYWAGLAALGIRLMSGTQRSCLAFGPDGLSDRDMPIWSPSLPERPADLYEATTFNLTSEEAEFLRDRIANRARGSLFAELAGTGETFQQDWVWRLTHKAISKENREILRHAERFSTMMYGASLLYNLMLAERAKDRSKAKMHPAAAGLLDEYEDGIRRWSAEMESLAFDDWDLGELFSLVGRTSHRLHERTRSFVIDWATIAIPNAQSIATLPEARDLLRRRERSLKGPKARLTEDAPLDRWSGASANYRLGFRWNMARSYLGELADAG